MYSPSSLFYSPLSWENSSERIEVTSLKNANKGHVIDHC